MDSIKTSLELPDCTFLVDTSEELELDIDPAEPEEDKRTKNWTMKTT